jgi:hypothetical protein
MTEHGESSETRPQTPQGEARGLVHDLVVGAAGSGLWKGAEVIGGRIVGQLHPSVQPNVPPPNPSAPSEGAGAPDTASEGSANGT